MKNNPKISVIIPIWNDGKYLAECLDSVLCQTHANLELVCVNDGSTDNTADILSDYAKRDKRIKIVSQENSGVSVARNAGILAATGDYINFIDADDRLENSDYYKRMLDALKQSGAEVASGDFRDSKRPNKLDLDYKKIQLLKTMDEKIKGARVVRRASACRWLLPREFILRNNLFFMPERFLEDYIWSISVAYYAEGIATVPGSIYWYRRTSGSILRDPARARQREIDKNFIYDLAVKFADARGFSLGFRRGFIRRLKMKLRGAYNKDYDEALTQTPKISVIIPLLNKEKYLTECLDSVLAQTYENLEILCINDGSSDGSADILADYASRDARIKVFNQTHSGVSVARNVGMREASGDYIHFMDGDDKLWSKDFYERMCASIVQSISDIAVSDVIDEKYPGAPRIGYEKLRIVSDKNKKIKSSHVVGRPAVWRFLWRREFLAASGLSFNPKHQTAQDVMFSIPAVYLARRLVVVPGAFYRYRRNPTGNIRSQGSGHKRGNLDIALARSRFAKEHKIDLGFNLGLKYNVKLWLLGALKFREIF